MVGISVLICTFNGKEKLLPTLNHLFAQNNLSSLDWEIIIIDNSSSDGTYAWVKSFIHTTGNFENIYLYQEPIPGKFAAIKLGISKSKYDYLLICDDDNWLAPNYLIRGYNILNENPKIGILGGNGRPVGSLQIPSWLVPHLHNYAAAPQQPFSADLTNSIGSVYGAGMFIRKEIYLKSFDLDWPMFLSSKRVGKNIVSGEDTEICYIAKRLGYRIFYDESLLFEHDIPQSKINQQYLLRLFHLFGFSDAILYPYKDGGSFKNKYACKLLLEIYRLVRYNLIHKKHIDYLSQQKAYEFRLGYIKGLLFNYREIHQLKTFLKKFDTSTPHHFEQRS